MEDSIGLPVVDVSYGGAWQFQGNDEHGLLRSLNGRLFGVHKNVVQQCRNRVQRTTRLTSWDMTVVARFRFKAKFVMQ